MKVWKDGKIEDSPRTIDSLNYSLHYGSPCVWEGIRSYSQANGTTSVFRLRQHISRLFDSAKIMGFTIPYTKDQLITACEHTVAAAGGGDTYIRPVAYSSNDAKKAKPQEENIQVDIYVFPMDPLHKGKDGIKMAISSYSRGYPQFQMQAKTASNYHFLETVKKEMKGRGVDDMFVTDNDGYITEATVANLWVFKNGQAVTPPNDGSILPGITRATVQNLLTNESMLISSGIKPGIVTEKKITRADLYTADEVILCGTYAEIVKVGEIDGRKIEGEPKFYDFLNKAYGNLVRGK